MGHQPERRRPFVLWCHHLDQIGAAVFFPNGHKPDPRAGRHRINQNVVVRGAIDDPVRGHVLGKPTIERRAIFGAFRPYKRMSGKIIRPLGQPEFIDIGLRRNQRDPLRKERLHDIVGLVGCLSGANGDMRFAVFETEQPVIGQEPNADIRVFAAEPDQNWRDQRRQTGK